MSRTVALRESTAFLALTYALALAIAIALPHAGINRMLSVLATLASVVIVAGILLATAKVWRDQAQIWPSRRSSASSSVPS
jgi:uncharacterized membrane protein YoaK (UPF0700 family)